MGYETMPIQTNPPSRVSKGKFPDPDESETLETDRTRLSTFLNEPEVSNRNVDASLIASTHEIPISILLDTGALQANYISRKLVEQARIPIIGQPGQVKSGFLGDKHRSYGHCLINFDFFNEITRSIERMQAKCTVLDIAFDVIIGKRTLYAQNMLNKVHDQFWLGNRSGVGVSSSPALLTRDVVDGSNPLAHHLLATLLEGLSDHDMIQSGSEEFENYTLEPIYGDGTSTDQDLIPRRIEGMPNTKVSLRKLCHEYIDIFRREVYDTPAQIKPLELDVMNTEWEIAKNSGPPRPMSTAKQAEVAKQIQNMLRLGVIKKSQSRYYSQVLLTPKPDNKWRFCIDYRRLNLLSKMGGWPIPNIQQMMQRIGSHKPKYFAVLDLVSGYHQAPLHPDSQKYTAFTTFMGVYEWTRVPMGLKGAPAYFQEAIAGTVLGGLIHNICELYIDDCIIWADSEEQLEERLRAVFERFRQHNIAVHPDKAVLGVTEIEYVGYVLSQTGLHFSREKINSAIQLARPKTQQELKQFLGLANYFGNHLQGLNHIMGPLNLMLQGYTKGSKRILLWTQQGADAYSKLVDRIKNCPKLWFINENEPIYLHTDACNYGVGAYLFQIINGQEQPIAFLSRAFRDAQLNWSTAEQEAYAIYYAFMKFEHLIRDVPFILRTDHRNLTFLDMGAGKVLRWKLAIQEYNFRVEHIPGEENIVADALSRLCSMEPVENLRIPEDIHKEISRYHNSYTSGHFGVDITYRKMKEAGNKTPNLLQYIRAFIRKCPCCQKMSYLKAPIHTTPYTLATYAPMQQISIDTIGPLPISSQGNAYVLVIIDNCTRFVDLYPIVDTTSASAVNALMQHVARFGHPLEIRSDKGTQFVSELFTGLLKLLHMEHIITAPYSKQENAIVERSNKEVMRHLRAIVHDDKIITSWDMSLPLVMRIMNNKVHEATNETPATLLFGRANTHELAMFNQPLEQKTLTEWSSQMIELQTKVLHAALKHQHQLDVANVRKRSQSIDDKYVEFPVGSYVLLNPVEGKPEHKLSTYLDGPFQVVSNVGAKYTIRNIYTNVEMERHIKWLRPFHYDEEQVNPREEANKSNQAYDVETILTHRGNSKVKSKMEFKVKWVGYDEPSWEPYKALSSNAYLHQYFKDHKMEHHIPKRFRSSSLLGEVV